jgi:ribosomal protein L16 Arg81 hydroxylase
VPSNERMNITGCDFDVRSELTADEFMREYMMLQKPVLIRNGMVKGRHAHIQATPVRQTARHSTRASHAEHAAVWHVPECAMRETQCVHACVFVLV